MVTPDPDYYAIISRQAIEEAAASLSEDDPLGILAREMLAAIDEREVFKRAVRGYISKTDQKKRRFAITALAATFGVKDRGELKRLLRFWGLVNEFD
jgi:hypothetical protein